MQILAISQGVYVNNIALRLALKHPRSLLCALLPVNMHCDDIVWEHVYAAAQDMVLNSCMACVKGRRINACTQ